MSYMLMMMSAEHCLFSLSGPYATYRHLYLRRNAESFFFFIVEYKIKYKDQYVIISKMLFSVIFIISDFNLKIG